MRLIDWDLCLAAMSAPNARRSRTFITARQRGLTSNEAKVASVILNRQGTDQRHALMILASKMSDDVWTQVLILMQLTDLETDSDRACAKSRQAQILARSLPPTEDNRLLCDWTTCMRIRHCNFSPSWIRLSRSFEQLFKYGQKDAVTLALLYVRRQMIQGRSDRVLHLLDRLEKLFEGHSIPFKESDQIEVQTLRRAILEKNRRLRVRNHPPHRHHQGASKKRESRLDDTSRRRR